MKKYDAIHIRDYYPSKENPASSPWVYDQVKSLQTFGIKSLVISPTPYLPDFMRAKGKFYLYPKADSSIQDYYGTSVVRPQYFKIPKNKFLIFSLNRISNCIYKAARLINTVKIIHAHFGQNGYAAIKLKQKLGVPLVTSFYGYDSGRLGRIYKPYYKILSKYGDLFLALSEDMKSDLLNLGFPADKIVIHHLGINPKQFTVVESKRKKKFVYLVVARLDESKGVQDVIKAFNIISQCNMELRIIGDGIYKSELIQLVKSLKLQNQVQFINNFRSVNPRQVVVNEMQNCDVALLTSFLASNGAKEGTPVVLMEAQACGKPCITTFHAGNPEVVIDNHTGLFIKERDISTLAQKMNLLYMNDKLRGKLATNARDHVLNNFNQEIQMQKLIKIYTDLMN